MRRLRARPAQRQVLDVEHGAGRAFCGRGRRGGIMGARYDLDLAGRTFQPCW